MATAACIISYRAPVKFFATDYYLICIKLSKYHVVLLVGVVLFLAMNFVTATIVVYTIM